jgi:hypothetical protein
VFRQTVLNFIMKKKPKLFPPNFKRSGVDCYSPSSDLSTLPKPWIRRFPDPNGKRRKVELHYSRYILHFHTWLEEECNPIWDGRPNDYNPESPGGWTKFFADKEDESHRFDAPPTRYEKRMRLWAVVAFLKHFSPETHKLVNTYGEEIGMDGKPFADEEDS